VDRLPPGSTSLYIIYCNCYPWPACVHRYVSTVLADAGVKYPRVYGGYKAMRRFPVRHALNPQCKVLAHCIVGRRP